ncbi:hypothetical protein CLV51_10490 [Chitinophaga niastensis]|uniref:DUF1440 domain-containing protein n=1 Tax=Chitinophaga niastensis TaxID=536980 RepID=A0A2P8HGP6_CHINA|nr:hypothetical protein [Chitinophaga niastensis]PSL45388.1 hypothetical protein CLV51_10490 [Chitinophaga niastensis]
MLKKLLLLGVISGALAGIASLIYQKVYASSLGAGFTNIAKPVGIMLSSVIGCLIAALGYWLLSKVLKGKTEIVFNLLFAILSFVSILGPFAAKLPLDIETPELFPGLTIPMHFFPALAWFTLRPLFITVNAENK